MFGVLIGNWGEERYIVSFFVNLVVVYVYVYLLFSIYRVDFRNYGFYRFDVIVRRKVLMRNDGLG